MDTLNLTAPAKINLYLEVGGRRDDGFHELATVMQTLELSDDVTLTLSDEPGVRLELTEPAADVPTGPDNLAVRAAVELLGVIGATERVGLDIRLRKRIPSGAGLGGGSSDAAAVLRGLHELLDAPCDVATLVSVAAALGSDVPFFLKGGCALCTGRGEHVEPLAPPRRFEVTLLLPDFGLSTPAVYGALDAGPLAPDWTPQLDAWARQLGGVEAKTLQQGFRNDLETAARQLAPALADWLDHFPLHLSGSGSTLFCFDRPDVQLVQACEANYIRIVRTASSNRV